VEAPFWKTWWFYGMIILAMIGIFLWIDRERMRRIRELQKVRAEIAGNLHQEINTTLNNINILSEMAKMKADRDIVRSKEYIEQISEKSHNMIIAMDDILWSIDPENDAMDETIMRLQEFISSLQSRYQCIVNLKIEDDVHQLKLDMKLRHEFFILLKSGLRLIIEEAGGIIPATGWSPKCVANPLLFFQTNLL
jgi:signal transduction histidine kinase